VRKENKEISRYILQRINSNVFKEPIKLMENIVNVTNYLKNNIIKNGGDYKRETLNVVKTKDNKDYFIDSEGQTWRVFYFIDDIFCLQSVEKSEHFYESAKSFGRFMKQLSDFPVETLHETIPRFHDTPNRLENLKIAIKEDRVGRVKLVKNEIEFALLREKDCSYLMDKLGLCANDFGDSIRFGATTAAEDEPDTSRMHFDIELFEIYLKGYLEETGNILTNEEKLSLVWGSKLMTLECGIRFLTDYLNGDTYFKISHENHNLDRTRTQFKLVDEMEQNFNKMLDIVTKY